ncbi:MAG: ABC transporter permease [Planctomycetes bacterium]|nr:ABC transporter permease [Planctomycetota bacterium]
MSEDTAPQQSAVAAVGERTIGILDHIGGLWWLLAETVRWLMIAAVSKKVRVGRVAITSQMVRIGVSSVFIVALVSGSIGFILGFQMAPPLDNLGSVHLVPNIIAVAVLRELGPLIAAIVMVGFAGASIAAEIGTMVVGEEIEALEAHALNPVRFLVVPRVIASVVSLVCLSVISDLVAIFAAAVMSKTILGISWIAYYDGTVSQVGPIDFLTGLAKAAIFGLLIGLIACGNGLKVTGGAAGVGRATTGTVVQSVVAVIFADLLFTVVFYALKLF